MAVSRALRRLLHIRDLEEEQCRQALESATGSLHRLEDASAAAVERGHAGRRALEASAHSGELADRLGGLEEIRAAGRYSLALAPVIADAEDKVAALREELLAKRVERRQAETLIKETEASDALETGRRTQQNLDDWFGNRTHRKGKDVDPALKKPPESDRPS